jgi:putative redox protein
MGFECTLLTIDYSPFTIHYLRKKWAMAIMNAERTHGDFGFTITDEKGHVMTIDIPEDQGGGATGFRPMQTVLAALCGCSGVDVVSILKKQRQQYDSLKIFIDGEREKGKEPSIWATVDIRFELTGEVDPSKAYRAVELSVNKYCSVAETLRRSGTQLTWSVLVNGVKAEF